MQTGILLLTWMPWTLLNRSCFVRRGILLNVNEPEVRGVTLAMQTVLDDLGKGLGPLIVAQMITAWGRCASLARVTGLFRCCLSPIALDLCPRSGS